MKPTVKIRSCGTMEVFNRQAELFPEYRLTQARIEDRISTLLGNERHYRLAEPVSIKVVVHVVYATDEENISEAQIWSQIKVLNDDYRGKNADKSKVPTVWSGLVADSLISFELASIAPDGSKTNGITRTKTAVSGFGTNDAVKDLDKGGINPWDTEKYLNIWVCSLEDGLLGYAQFPGGPSATDGVVIEYSAFGTEGTAIEPFHLGRTTTHEIGHYLNLSHIFGDGRGNTCNDSDYVFDTPNQLGPNYQKPTFPSMSCNNSPNGDMFMNYMDYVDDDTMFMFTTEQAARMNATLADIRNSLIRNVS